MKKLPVVNPVVDPSHPMLEQRPTKRDDCRNGPRPCPWVSCQFNTFIKGIDSLGRIIRHVPYSHPEDANPTTSCLLDIEETTGLTLKDVGEYFRLSRERIRQIQRDALAKLRRKPVIKELQQFLESDPTPGKGRNSEET